jgi:Bifunctional DNA primase/polymerase, N-terminal
VSHPGQKDKHSNRALLPSKSCGAAGALLDHALDYAGRGWSIIPTTGKKASGLWRPFQTQPADEKTLRHLFAQKGITGLAVILGGVSGGLAVRDFDQADAYHARSAGKAMLRLDAGRRQKCHSNAYQGPYRCRTRRTRPGGVLPGRTRATPWRFRKS